MSPFKKKEDKHVSPSGKEMTKKQVQEYHASKNIKKKSNSKKKKY